jgi:hypothetical protein
MSLPHPTTFKAPFTDARLREVAVRLLDVRYNTIRELNSPYDDNYTREGAVFGRSRNMLIELALSKQFDWLSLCHAGMDITCKIDDIPFRFFRDDPDSPAKAGFFKRNNFDCLFEDEENAPVMWRFVVEKAMFEEDEDRVYFVGYNVYQEKVSEWVYTGAVTKLHSVDHDIPAAADIPAPDVDVRDVPGQDEKPSKTGNDE